MVENLSSSPLFAGRYRFQPESDDWDRGRSDYTHLVFDTQKEQLGVIKRAEIKSQQAIEGLKNEVKALVELKGLGVPEIYDSGEAEYGSRNYFYIVIEYIEGLRVEKDLFTLLPGDRADIITQLFALLAKAHQMGIVNGDVDLKHLFWRKDRKQLVVIDWGNAKLHVNPKYQSEFAFDLARSAEIVYSLATLKGYVPGTGSLALPKDAGIFPGLAPVPIEFRDLCKWAPRAPTVGAKAPYSALELLEIAKRWKEAIDKRKRYQPRNSLTSLHKGQLFLAFLAILILSATATIFFSNSTAISRPPTSTLISSMTPSLTSISPTDLISPSPSAAAMMSPTLELDLTATPIIIPSIATIPSSRKYSPLLVLDNRFDQNNCWQNTLNNLPDLVERTEAFTRREDSFWSFATEKNRKLTDRFQSNFSQCLDMKLLGSLSINVWVSQIEPKQEFGFFLTDVNGNTREYTIWLERVNQVDKMYLRLRENALVTDYELLSTKFLESQDAFPALYYRFSYLAFLEINNEGLDILYLKEIPQQKFRGVVDIDPNQLIRADNAIRPTLGNIQSVGLVAYGGEIETAIWPLVFLVTK